MNTARTTLANLGGQWREFEFARPRAGARQDACLAENAKRGTREEGYNVLQRGKRTHRKVCLRVPSLSLRVRLQGLPKMESRRVGTAAQFRNASEPPFIRRGGAGRLRDAHARKTRAYHC